MGAGSGRVGLAAATGRARLGSGRRCHPGRPAAGSAAESKRACCVGAAVCAEGRRMIVTAAVALCLSVKKRQHLVLAGLPVAEYT